MARLQHPNLPGRVINVAERAAGHYANSGWVPVEGEPPPTCPTCGTVWPAYRQDQQEPEPQTSEEAPAPAGASSSPPRRRRKTEESE